MASRSGSGIPPRSAGPGTVVSPQQSACVLRMTHAHCALLSQPVTEKCGAVPPRGNELAPAEMHPPSPLPHCTEPRRLARPLSQGLYSTVPESSKISPGASDSASGPARRITVGLTEYSDHPSHAANGAASDCPPGASYRPAGADFSK